MTKVPLGLAGGDGVQRGVRIDLGAVLPLREQQRDRGEVVQRHCAASRVDQLGEQGVDVPLRQERDPGQGLGPAWRRAAMFSVPVFVEMLTNGYYPEREAELDGYGLVFEYLRSSAPNPTESLDKITAISAET
ncbi:hypothetical protein [Kitasatospora cathayae]|uniref:Uncharacterized protein n=1 Tax=Kitasatospora cathayae TaxID=3004092 RepID=A0ABY7QBK5_9ACTN|nr:hypothetical protein [Kitasatospora sp. HUAS 3-15]WBP89992.1 hypothetical protein O1G21_31870 [Kitasatospora sp. HUAS 3-15]